jgi:hypothetical protein
MPHHAGNALGSGSLSELRVLDLRGNGITSVGLAFLAETLIETHRVRQYELQVAHPRRYLRRQDHTDGVGRHHLGLLQGHLQVGGGCQGLGCYRRTNYSLGLKDETVGRASSLDLWSCRGVQLEFDGDWPAAEGEGTWAAEEHTGMEARHAGGWVSPCPHLEQLLLSYNYIGAEGVAALTEVSTTGPWELTLMFNSGELHFT